MLKQALMSALLLGTGLAWATDARAQTAQPTAPTSTLEGVVVVAPRITFDTERVPRSARGSVLPAEVTEATETVPLQGIDLTRTADLFVLEERVELAANRVCSALVQKYPEGEPSKDVCIERAMDDAMAQVRRMTRAAVANR